jgi:hypothetical protein
MIGEVAAMIGGDANLRDRAQAEMALDRAADTMNAAGVYMFKRADVTFDSFTLGQTTLAAPSDWGWPDAGVRVYNANSELLGVMEWLDWNVFQRQVTSAQNGRPQWISMASELDSNFSIFPYIDTSDVDSIVIPYISRVSRPSAVVEMIITPEAREALIRGGEAFVLRRRYASKPAVWLPFWHHFQEAITQAKGSSWRYRQSVHGGAAPMEVGQNHGLAGALNGTALISF